MAAAVPDPDLPFDDGVSCGVGEVAGLFFDVEECRREGGLFYRMVCREDVVFDINPDRVSVKNGETELSVNLEDITLKTPLSEISVSDQVAKIQVGETLITINNEGVSISAKNVYVASPSVHMSGDLKVDGEVDAGSMTVGTVHSGNIFAKDISTSSGISLSSHVHKVTVDEEGEGTTTPPTVILP